MERHGLIASIVGCLFSLTISACGSDTPIPADLPMPERLALVDSRLEEASAKGASGILTIRRRGETIYERGFGSASCAGDEPVTPQHLFMIGSITKELTRLLAYVLEERGYVSLDDRLSERVADLSGPLAAVTLRELIEHTAGLPDFIDENGHEVEYSVEYDYRPVSRDELISRAQKASLHADWRGEEHYSNLGYQLLAATFEIVTNLPYPELLRRYVYAPAGMTATDFWFDDAENRNFADGCRGDQRWGNPIDDSMWGPNGPSWNLMGAGGLLSTAESLARFFEGIGKGVYFQTVAQNEAYRTARLRFSERRRQLVMGPAGSNGIFNAVAFWMDGDEVALVMFTNRAKHQAEDGLIQDVLGCFPPGKFPRSDTGYP
jgi:CubicO group peptidase (beta-lactamase class C family)